MGGAWAGADPSPSSTQAPSPGSMPTPPSLRRRPDGAPPPQGCHRMRRTCISAQLYSGDTRQAHGQDMGMKLLNPHRADQNRAIRADQPNLGGQGVLMGEPSTSALDTRLMP